ncbi:MAG TPA: hypothetical protein VF075_06560 [Pyrinomonadaceae bacterium]
MNKSRRKFLEKSPSIAIAAGVGVAAGSLAMGSASAASNDGTRPLLDAVVDGQAKINGRLYYSTDLMLDVLRELIANVPGIDAAAAEAKINAAAQYIEAVPDINPPGCTPPCTTNCGGG